jgi:pimeloyl-ACP methyl ester carboxylesterase
MQRISRVGLAGQVPDHFIVIVPGFMGSRLRSRKTGNIEWIDFSSVPRVPFQWDAWLDHLFNTLHYPNEDLVADGIINEVVFVPPWAKQEEYARLMRELEKLGYRTDSAKHSEKELDVYAFAYDWRQDNRVSGHQLAQAIEHWTQFHPGAEPWIIAHSNGGIVARWYIEKEGGKGTVGRLFLLASPWDGSVKALRVLYQGLDVLFRRRFSPFGIPQRTRETLRTFPSIYQLIPHADPFLRSLNNEVVDPFEGKNWLGGKQETAMLADAARFNQELGAGLSVDTLCFFGRNLLTTTYGVVRFGANGRWNTIEWHDTEAGDGTLSERTAINPNAREQIPILAGHGDIYVNPNLLEILKWELSDKYRMVTRATKRQLPTGITFTTDQEIYSLGQPIRLVATIKDEKDRSGSFSRSSIVAQINWHSNLPGTQILQNHPETREIQLWQNRGILGRYEGTLSAPETEGYYQVRVRVKMPGQPAVLIDELIAVESD